MTAKLTNQGITPQTTWITVPNRDKQFAFERIYDTRPFVRWSLVPTFKVESADSTLILTSGQVDYKIIGKTTDSDHTGFFRYARLNAYKKAMTEKKLPPFAELKVLEELETRKMLPKSMEVRIPGVPGAPTINLVYNEKH
jgi:hypothetical protein